MVALGVRMQHYRLGRGFRNVNGFCGRFRRLGRTLAMSPAITGIREELSANVKTAVLSAARSWGSRAGEMDFGLLPHPNSNPARREPPSTGAK